MCGICGIIHFELIRAVEQLQLLRMHDSMEHRGPDDSGLYINENIGLGSRRLSIIDLSKRGHMPMFSSNERFVIVYNGEIYNYLELRANLEGKGWQFRSNTDTEVILALYTEMGSGMLEHLNGMFAIAIWDAREKSLFLARDRMGVKPVFYSNWQNTFYFASEIKSILSAGVPSLFDHSCWGELLCFRYLAGEATPYQHIKELLPGHYLIVSDRFITTRRWWNLSDGILNQREKLPVNPVEWFRSTFDDAVSLRRISDVPLGVLLSGGLDSSSLAASLAIQAGNHVNSFTVRFDEDGYDESSIARDMAEKWHLKYHELSVSREEIVPLLHESMRLNDEPLAHGNELHILAIARFAKELVTVLLSGDGADEILGGYVRYRPLLAANGIVRSAPLLKWLDKMFFWEGRWHKLARFLRMDSLDNFLLFNACDVLPSDLEAVGFYMPIQLDFRQTMFDEAKQVFPGEPVRQAMYLDQHTFLVSELDRIDRMTMGASIEARVPFLDYRLIQISGALPTSTHFRGLLGKQLLRRAFSERLPRLVKRNPKWGFGVPWKQYFRCIPELREIVADLPEQPLIADGPFDLKKIRSISSEYLGGDDGSVALIHQLSMIALWSQEMHESAH